MFGIDSSELLIVAIVALLVIGPKDLPRVMRTVGQWVARARGIGQHFRSGIDTMIRESELEEMQKKWAADNERIMREHPMPPPGSPDPAPASTPSLIKQSPPSLSKAEQGFPLEVSTPMPARAQPPRPPVRGPAASVARARPAPPAPPRELP